MVKSIVAASARSGFALGLSAGLVLASAAFMLLEPTKAGEATSRWHSGATQGSLGSAIQLSARLLPEMSATSVGIPTPGATADTVGETLARAGDHRRKREFKQACDLYAAVVARGAMTADAWADYADAQATLAGGLSGDPARAIAAALALDPSHPKALWLQASLAHEERRYRDALDTWRRLLAVVPPGSSDARIVEANIAEASRLATS
jgi:hypothetical protein